MDRLGDLDHVPEQDRLGCRPRHSRRGLPANQWAAPNRRQRQNRNRLGKRATGLRVSLSGTSDQISITAFRTEYAHPVAGSGNSRRTHFNPGIDWKFARGRNAVFGEATGRGGRLSAFVAGSVISLPPLTLSLLGLRYSRFHSATRSTSFSAYSGNPGNEWGMFVGAIWRPVRGTAIEASLDRHGRLGPTRNLPLPDRGYRFDLRVKRRLTRSLFAGVTLGTRRETVYSKSAHTRRAQGRIRLTWPEMPGGYIGPPGLRTPGRKHLIVRDPASHSARRCGSAGFTDSTSGRPDSGSPPSNPESTPSNPKSGAEPGCRCSLEKGSDAAFDLVGGSDPAW